MRPATCRCTDGTLGLSQPLVDLDMHALVLLLPKRPLPAQVCTHPPWCAGWNRGFTGLLPIFSCLQSSPWIILEALPIRPA